MRVGQEQLNIKLPNCTLRMPFSQVLLLPFLFVVVGLLVFLLAPVPQQNALYSNSTHQSHPGNASTRRWMSDLRDDLEVSYLSLPGTHDSGSYNCHFWQLCKSTQCQSWPIIKQLQAGIRFLDLRIQIFNEQLTIVHGEIKLGKFQEDFADISRFLKEHPSQFLILAFQAHEDTPNNQVAVTQALKRHDIAFLLSEKIPTVAQLRGKVWVLRGLGIEFHPPTYDLEGLYGIQDQNHIYYQNYYEIKDQFSIQDKVYEVLKAAFTVTNKNKKNRTRLKINALSASSIDHWTGIFTGPYPYMIAFHPMGPNAQLNEELRKHTRVSLGITVMDFPGNGIIERIINSNEFVHHLKFRQPIH